MPYISTLVKRSYIAGLVLTISGCFLPWQVEGDFISYWKFGIRIFPTFEDNGGVVVLILCISLGVLIFKSPAFMEEKQKWAIAINAALVLDSAIQICLVLIEHFTQSRIGVPVIYIGLVIVFIGSVILFTTSLLHFQKSMRQN